MQAESIRNEERREDGLLIYRGLDGWIIIPAGEGPALDRCPCCQQLLPSLDAARAIADQVFPMRVSQTG